MTKRVAIPIITAAALTAAAFGCLVFSAGTSPNPSDVPSFIRRGAGRFQGVPSLIPINADAFIDRNRFLATGSATGTALVGKPVAGVVNHHILAADLISRFFRTLKAARPDVTRFVILSPDHFKAGADTVSVGDVAFVTDGKTVSSDADVVRALVTDRVASIADRRLFEKEHGIGALIPFLVREYPDATIIPIVIRSDVPRDRMADLGALLAALIDEKTFVVVSSDMSHYLAEGEALRNDAETASWLESLDRKRLASAADDHTDSGVSLTAIAAMFDALKKTPRFTVTDHSISSRYGGDPSNTTSYINGFWIIP